MARRILLINIVIWYSIAIIALLSGCCRQAAPVQSTQQDSVRVERSTEYIERIVHDTVEIEIPAQLAERTTRDSSSHLETAYAESDASILPDGSLRHTLNNKQQQRPISVPTIERVRTVTRDSIIYREKRVDVPVVQPPTTWQRAQMWAGRIAVLLLITSIIYKAKIKL